MSKEKEEATFKDYVRFCEFHRREYCNNCPLDHRNNKTHKGCVVYIKEHTDKANNAILKWAKEHPSTTNLDKLKEIFPEAFLLKKICPQALYESFKCSADIYCDDCINKFWNSEYKKTLCNECEEKDEV